MTVGRRIVTQNVVESCTDSFSAVFGKTEAEACNIAETTHVHQKATVGSYTLDIAKSKVAKATAMARAEGFPLRFEIQ